MSTQQKSLGMYQILYQEAINQNDFQKALKYLQQVAVQNPEQDKLWQSEIIQCLSALKLHKQCAERIIQHQKTVPKGDHVNNLNTLNTLIQSYLGLYNYAKANDCIKQMDYSLKNLSAESTQSQFIESCSKTIQDLKLKIDTSQVVPDDERKSEAKRYKKLEEQQEDSSIFKEAGNTVYLIPTQWLVKWKEYSFYKEMYEESDNMDDENEEKKPFEQIYPGPIDASILVENVKNHHLDTNDSTFFENYVLKSDKAEKHDFEIVSSDIADFFYSIYGGFKLMRKTILNPVTNEVNVELFFKKINFIPIPTIAPSQDKNSLYVVYISKYANCQLLHDKIKRCLQNITQINSTIYNRQYFKFWKLTSSLEKNYSQIFETFRDKYKEPTIQLNVKEIVIGQDETIEDMQLGEGSILIFELSQTDKFKIVVAPLSRKQSSKIEQETSNSISDKSTKMSTSSSEMQEESVEPKEKFPSGKIKIRKIDEDHVKNMMQKFRITSGPKTPQGKKGLCGLQNLGNTCFMNSSLQCLSNVEELTTFMINNDYVNDLNPDNPLGASGFLAVSYADLARELWQGSDSYVSPHYLKKVIGKFAPQFYGYSQQDSQELLSYLLDGLHEDLNRIKKKPIVESIDYSGGNDQEMSHKFFKNYKKRNDSVISDLMVGQFKSTLVCPDKRCGKVSITFDPFLTLSVPIPRVTKEEIMFYLIHKDHRKIPAKIDIQVNSTTLISELKEMISENFNIPAASLIVTNSFQSKIEEFIGDDDRAGRLKEISGMAFVYEVDKAGVSLKKLALEESTAMEEEEQDEALEKSEPTSTKKHTAVAQNDGDQVDLEEEEEMKSQVSKKKSVSSNEPYVYTEIEFCQLSVDSKATLRDASIPLNNIHTFSYSRLISLKQSSTISDLYFQIYKILRVYLDIYKKAPTESRFKESYSSVDDFVPKIQTEIDIQDDSLERLQSEIEQFEKDDQKLFILVNKDLRPLDHKSKDSILSMRIENKNRLYVKIVLDKTFDVKFLRSKRCEAQSFENSKSTKEHNSGATNLYDCIDAFVKKEQLEKGNEWYCNKCKKHVLATKQMEIYQTPKILIVHLKRFKSGNVRNFGRYYFESGGKKINDLIDFPCENLNMTKYVLGADGKPQIYDLFAVSQHYGGMGGGHYTACAQNFVNKRWYNFNDSHVSQSSPDQAVSSAAYVLFYRRRE